jgi:D-aspartate ligase
MRKIVILDAQTIQTLAVSKSLKGSDYYVILMCDGKNSYGFHTKYADRKIIVPSIQNETEAFHLFFMDFLQKEEIDVVIPMNDYSAQYLSKNKGTLEKLTNFIIPTYDIFINAYNKNRLMKICEANGFPHPKTVDLTTCNIEEADKSVKFPALIKPNISTGARGIAYVQSIAELQKKLPHIVDIYGDCHLQEFIPSGGHQYKVELFINNQKLINSTVIDKIRFYPPKGGSSCYIQTVEYKNLVDICFNLSIVLDWEGFIDFDLIEDPNDGIVKIMEINPRIPATIKASIISGVDFIENIVDGSLKHPIKTHKYLPGKYLRYFGMDILWLFTSKRQVKTKSSWTKTLFSSSEYLEDGSYDDIKPFIYGTIGGILKQMNRHFRESKSEMT